MFHELLRAFQETILMVFLSGMMTVIIGLPLGIALVITRPKQFMAQVLVYRSLSFIVNSSRSVPYIIFMVALIPLTRLIVGSADGSLAACVPLTLAAVPFFARLAETAMQAIQPGLIEAAISFGASPKQIITKVLLPESQSGLIQAITVTLVNLVGFSAMAGALGGGGLGSLAIHQGYHGLKMDYVVYTVLITIVLVQGIQACGDYVAKGSYQFK